MRYLQGSIVVCLLAMMVQGCKKDDTNQPTGNEPPAYKYLLKSIEWDNGTKATVHYNNDSTIQYMAYANAASSEVVNFTWSGKKLVNMSYASSMYTNTFNYNNGILVSVVNAYKDQRSPHGYKFEYAYGANGNLSELKYFTINEAGAKLVTTSTYDYKATGELQSITTTQTNNVKIKFTMEGYSENCEFNPWTFISPALHEWYALYNYPVLSNLKKWPVKITRTIQEPGQTDRVERIDESVYTITNQRLDKITTTVSYPRHPELNQSYNTVFSY